MTRQYIPWWALPFAVIEFVVVNWVVCPALGIWAV